MALLDLPPSLLQGPGRNRAAVHLPLDHARDAPLRSMARVAVGRAMAVGLAALAEAGLERSRAQVADGADLVEQFAAARECPEYVRPRSAMPPVSTAQLQSVTFLTFKTYTPRNLTGVSFAFEVSQSATDPGKQVIGVNRVRALQNDSVWNQQKEDQ